MKWLVEGDAAEVVDGFSWPAAGCGGKWMAAKFELLGGLCPGCVATSGDFRDRC